MKVPARILSASGKSASVSREEIARPPYGKRPASLPEPAVSAPVLLKGINPNKK